MPEDERGADGQPIGALSTMLQEIVREARRRGERWDFASLIERLELYRRYLEASGHAAADRAARAEDPRRPLSFAEFVADEALLARTAEELDEQEAARGDRDRRGR